MKGRGFLAISFSLLFLFLIFVTIQYEYWLFNEFIYIIPLFVIPTGIIISAIFDSRYILNMIMMYMGILLMFYSILIVFNKVSIFISIFLFVFSFTIIIDSIRKHKNFKNDPPPSTDSQQ